MEPIEGHGRYLDPPEERDHLPGCPLHEDYAPEEDERIVCKCEELELDEEADYGDRLNKEKKEG